MSSRVLLLHAMGSSHMMWRSQVEELGPTHDLLVPDLPGHGDCPGPFTLNAAAERVAALLNGRREPVHVVGASLGATVALRLASRMPDKVASLLVWGATVHILRANVAVQRAVTTMTPLSWTAAMSVRIARPADARDRQALFDDVRKAGKRTQAEGLRELANADVLPRLEAIKAPTLICSGRDDRANRRSAQTLAQGIHGAALQIMPGGHLWNLHYPELCTDTIRQHVNKNARKPPGLG